MRHEGRGHRTWQDVAIDPFSFDFCVEANSQSQILHSSDMLRLPREVMNILEDG